MTINIKCTSALAACVCLLLASGATAPASAQSAGTGYVKTKVNPGRAGVFIDGKYMGPAANFRIARKYAVPAGEHEVRLVDPRYEEVTRKVTVQAGQTTTVSEKLTPIAPATPPFGRLRTLGFTKFAAVYVNGKFYGHVDEFSNFAQALLLKPGEYQVRIVPLAEGSPQEETVKIEADQVTVVRAK